MREMLSSLLEWYLGALDQGGYLLVALLMAMESSIIPLPSEFVIPPAAYLAHAHGKMSLTGIVLAGTLGSWLGASVMYWASRLLGRPLLMRYGRWVMITPEKIEKAEAWSTHYGTMGVFVSRLLPVIRHLIGIPAGIVRMDYVKFSIYTLLGSAIWCAVLCWVGVKMGADIQQTTNLTHTLSKWLGLAALVLGGLYYFFVHRHMTKKPEIRNPILRPEATEGRPKSE
jgi:membrane protein DedA with SNARE-associated domain